MSVAEKSKVASSWGAWVWIKWKAGAPEDTWKEWKGVPEIQEAWSMTGAWDCILWVGVESPQKIEQIVWKEIRGNKWVERTKTHLAKKFW